MTIDITGESYFDVDGDRDIHAAISGEASHAPLTWRGDGKETLSDWTIVVVTQELQTFTYNVHKSVICFGTRQSKYFARIMLDKSASDGKRSKRKGVPTTKVELDQRDAENFPILLDYMYAPCHSISSTGTIATANSTMSSASLMPVLTDDTGDSLGSINSVMEYISTDKAVSLRYLARRFEVESFTLVVNRFIQRDLNFKTGPVYLSKASEYNDKRLMASAQRLCAENIEQVSSKALLKLPLHLFRVVVKSLESFREDNRGVSLCLSEIVCRYLEKHPKVLNATVLLEFTDPLIMPFIASEAAIGYSALIKELDPEDVKNHSKDLTRLSRRCAKSVVREYGWNDFSVEAAVEEFLHSKITTSENKNEKHRDCILFATSFAAAIEQAQDDYEAVIIEQGRLEEMVGSLNRTLGLLEEINDRKDAFIEKQQVLLNDAREQVRELTRQLQEAKCQRDYPGVLPSKSLGGSSQPYLDEMSTSSSRWKELLSPSQVMGSGIHSMRKNRELRTKSEMRSKSILS